MLRSRVSLPFWARVADACTGGLLVLAVFVAIHGGFVAELAGIRLSVRSEWRLLLWAVILVSVRHVFVRTPAIHRRLQSGISAGLSWMAADAKAAGPLADDLALAGAPEPRRPTRGKWLALGVIAVFAALTAFMTYPQILAMDVAVSRNYGDPLFSAWRLAWIAHQLPRDPLHLFNGNIFYPEERTLAFSDSMLVPALMTAPLLWLGVPQLVAYNISLLSGYALSGAGMFLLVRSLTGSTGAAFLGGFIFAFLPYRDMHYAHLELQMAQWMPMCLWALHRTIRSGKIGDGLLTGLFLALQCLSSWYYGIFLATFLIPVGIALWIGEGMARAKASVTPLLAGAGLAAVLVIPLALPYFAARQQVGERPESEIHFYSATPQNYLAAHLQNQTFGRRTWRLGGQERELFLGFLVPLIALVGLWPPLSAARIAYLLGLLLAFDVSLGFNGVLYPWLHEYVLPYRGLRVPARMGIVVGLALAVLAGYGAMRLMRLMPSRRAAALLLTLLVLSVYVEYRSRPFLKDVWDKPPAVYDLLPPDRKSVLLELPLMQPDIALEPIYMYFSTFHWNTLVNGYSGFSPPSYSLLNDLVKQFPDDASIAELRRRDVTHVIVHGSFYTPEAFADLVARLGHCADVDFVSEVPWQGRPSRLYRLLPKKISAHTIKADEEFLPDSASR